jgi:hypothetical protein
MFLRQEGSIKPPDKEHGQNVHTNNRDRLAADLQTGDSFDSFDSFDGKDPGNRTGIRSLGDGDCLPPPEPNPPQARVDLHAAKADESTDRPSSHVMMPNYIRPPSSHVASTYIRPPSSHVPPSSTGPPGYTAPTSYTAPPSDKPGRERGGHPKNQSITFYALRQARLQAAIAAPNRQQVQQGGRPAGHPRHA